MKSYGSRVRVVAAFVAIMGALAIVLSQVRPTAPTGPVDATVQTPAVAGDLPEVVVVASRG